MENTHSTGNGTDSGGSHPHERRHHHRSSRHQDREGEEEDDQHRHKRARHEREGDGSHEHRSHRRHHHRHHRRRSRDPARGRSEEKVASKDRSTRSSPDFNLEKEHGKLKRDTWMESPSALDIDYTQKGHKKTTPSQTLVSSNNGPKEMHKNGINLSQESTTQDLSNPDEDTQSEVDYTFGDSGSNWRMTQLKAVYRLAEETGRHVDDIAEERYGRLKDFDNAREERNELDRREMYGQGYVGTEKPNGDLFKEREQNARSHNDNTSRQTQTDSLADLQINTADTSETPQLNQTELNRLKAQLMKAKLKGASNLAKLEKEYEDAAEKSQSNGGSNVVVLDTMANRMLAGGRQGEVKPIENKRGRERGLVEENEDMSIEDMVREERRTRGQAGGEGRRFAERIAKDGKFDNDLDYMDENAAKLAKRVQKSEINLRNIAINDVQKINKALDSCPLCHHEDTNTPPIAPTVSLATRTFLTLPTEPEISEGGACIVPVQHRSNLLECDDDEWEEIRNFMKSLTRLFYDQGRDVIFYENAAQPQKRQHAAMMAIPLPYDLGETAPAFFKEAILSSDEEWTQHKKLIDTQARARRDFGKAAFRRSLAKEMPYFHVWFDIDGGLGHIVEDTNRWPKGDLFAREVIGGMLDASPEIIRKQGRWHRGDRRLEGFQKRWKKFDWTRILTEA